MSAPLAIYDHRAHEGLVLDLVIRTSKRKREAKSPKQQRDMADATCATHGYTIGMVHDSGKDESGKTMDRASLNAVIERTRAGLTNGAIVALADRLGRAPIEEAMAYVRTLTGIGVLVLADMGGVPLNLNDPAGETNVVLQLQIARQYWLSTAMRFQRSQRDAIKAGKWIGEAPFGFVKIKSGDEKGKLAPHPEHGKTMTEVYKIVGTDGIEKGVAYMERRTGRPWNSTDLRRLLDGKVYLGEIHYKGYPPNLKAHTPLTTPKLWAAAQTDPRFKRAHGDYPLTHMVCCGVCGAEGDWPGMVGWLQTVPYKDKVSSYRRMRCSQCKGNPINADKLEAHLKGVLAVLLGSETWTDLFTPSGLAETQAAFEAAQENRRELPRKVAFSDPDFDYWKAQADAEVERTGRAFREASAAEHQAETLPKANELHKPEQFARGLRAITRFDRIVIDAGTGSRDITGRVRIVSLNDDVTGALAA